MLWRWAYGLAALLLCIVLIQGSHLPRTAALALSGESPAASLFAPGQTNPYPAKLAHQAIETASSRAIGQGRRVSEQLGTGPDPVTTLVVVAIALVFALPLRGSRVASSLRIGMTPEGTHREAGRCPTGPPLFAV